MITHHICTQLDAQQESAVVRASLAGQEYLLYPYIAPARPSKHFPGIACISVVAVFQTKFLLIDHYGCRQLRSSASWHPPPPHGEHSVRQGRSSGLVHAWLAAASIQAWTRQSPLQPFATTDKCWYGGSEDGGLLGPDLQSTLRGDRS